MKIKVKGLVFAGLAATIFAGNAMATADTVVTSKAYVDQKLGLKANTADLATVATTGNYNDLSNKPTIPAAQVNADWNATEGVAQILNKPTIPTVPTNVSAFTNDANYITSADVPAQVNANWNATEGVAQILNKPTLAPVATSGNASDLTQDATHRLVTDTEKSTWSGKQDAISDLSTIRSGAASGATAVQPEDLATVATTGDYDDLTNKPTIPAAQVNSDWNSTSGVSQILNKPTIPTAVSDLNNDTGFITASQVPAAQTNADWNATEGAAQILNKPTLSSVATSGSYNDLSNKPTIPAAQVQSDWNATSGMGEILNKPSLSTVATTGNYSDLSGTPNLATVATSGSYNDLSNKPTIPAAQVQPDWNATSGMGEILNKPSLATVATSGNASDLTQDATHRLVTDTEKSTWNAKQDAISDLSTIRSGAALGATAIQPGTCTDAAPCALVNNQWVPIAQADE